MAHTRHTSALRHTSNTHAQHLEAHSHVAARTRRLGVVLAAARRARRFGAQIDLDERRKPPLAEEEVGGGRLIDRRVHVCETHEHTTIPAERCTAGASCKPPTVVVGVLRRPRRCTPR